MITGFPELPRDARKVAERSVACQHFAGEMSGDNSERDREVNRTISRLKCNQLEADTERLKRKYRNNPKVLQILGDALSWLET